MDITFSLQNGQYIAEFKVTSEFNLHIEKGVGSIQMFQRTSGTFFDKVEDFKMNKGDVVCDFDSGSFIGEKTIRLVSSVEPRYCFITTSGEVTEIKSQSKEVEVTANGTMDITPDAGFSYLSAVKVKTNVATSGGGSGSSMEYLDVRGLTEDKNSLIITAAILVKIEGGSIMASGIMAELLTLERDMVEAIAIIPSMLVKLPNMDNVTTIGELIAEYSFIPRITKEEFYNIA